MKSKIRWIVETGIFLAMLIVVQAVTKPLSTIVTGSAVNFILIASTLLVGISSGIIIAVVSPFLAMLLGIVPLPIFFVPVVALGNLVLVLTFGLILKKVNTNNITKRIVYWVITIILAAILKFFTLYLGIKWLVVPLMTSIKNAPVKAPIALFSTTQIFTALIGGFIALLIVPIIKKAIKR